MRPTKFTEAKFFDPSSTKIYCVLHLGPGPDQQDLDQENRATTISFKETKINRYPKNINL